MGQEIVSRVDVRYTDRVANPFVQSMASNFEEALRLMEAALTDCPADLIELRVAIEDATDTATDNRAHPAISLIQPEPA